MGAAPHPTSNRTALRIDTEKLCDTTVYNTQLANSGSHNFNLGWGHDELFDPSGEAKLTAWLGTRTFDHLIWWFWGVADAARNSHVIRRELWRHGSSNCFVESVLYPSP
jgi:hypothetical protein